VDQPALEGLWGWLPTFRAVAELEHVSRAAEQLGVSPSAVSRMITLLEAHVGQPLFNRVGRSVRLNAAGDHLLSAVRSAMRMVEEGLGLVSGTQFVGTLRIASAEPVTRAYLVPALDELRAAHPALVPSVRVAREEDVPAMLLAGELDVALVRLPLPRPQLTLERLGSLSSGVYAGERHPLHAARSVTLARVLEQPFVVLQAEEAPGLWWPPQYRRRVALRVEAVDLAADICAQGELLAVLPDVVAERHRQGGARLRRLPVEVVRPTEVYALWRERLELPGRAEALIDAVRRRLG
jgi:LysR family transcriptional regulator, glycine cleavage system transcriptional activator